ncbi:hypothetical protein GCM10022225_83180 [Plantactinospora mayteni]|uniref:Uncharacterized protein n=1 Tax=Plantactinospora mayteni TaxID=566021 RepID=A0ABQ4F4U8_9ACTN|nr:hypothetical protein Pma05_84850 [Plantactinospora mayteni]
MSAVASTEPNKALRQGRGKGHLRGTQAWILHSRAVSSKLAVAKVLPSGLNAELLTSSGR